MKAKLSALLLALLVSTFVPNAASSGVLLGVYRTVTPFVLNGDGEGVTRTTVWSYPLPDGVLGTTATQEARELRVRIKGTYINSGTSGLLTAFLVFGGQTWWSDSDTTVVSAVLRPFDLEFSIMNTTNASTQVNTGLIRMNYQTTNPSTGQGFWLSGSNEQTGTIRGTTTVNTASGGADTIAVDFQLPNTEATCILTIESVEMELRPPVNSHTGPP